MTELESMFMLVLNRAGGRATAEMLGTFLRWDKKRIGAVGRSLIKKRVVRSREVSYPVATLSFYEVI